MKKTIFLTCFLLLFSVVVDLCSGESGTSRSYSAIRQVFRSRQLIDSALLNKLALTENIAFDVKENVTTTILYKNIKGTVYHAEKSQCDDTPLITADNSFIDTARVNQLRWVALSKDLLNRQFYDPYKRYHVWNGKIKLGDTIWVDYDDKGLWKESHPYHKPVNHRVDSIINKKNDDRYAALKQKFERIKGYWIVHDVMGTHYYQQNLKGQYILDKNNKKQIVYIYKAIDFLQHPEYGMSDVWERHIILADRKVTKTITPYLAMD